jgi:hypothetical protein
MKLRWRVGTTKIFMHSTDINYSEEQWCSRSYCLWICSTFIYFFPPTEPTLNILINILCLERYIKRQTQFWVTLNKTVWRNVFFYNRSISSEINWLSLIKEVQRMGKKPTLNLYLPCNIIIYTRFIDQHFFPPHLNNDYNLNWCFDVQQFELHSLRKVHILRCSMLVSFFLFHVKPTTCLYKQCFIMS